MAIICDELLKDDKVKLYTNGGNLYGLGIVQHRQSEAYEESMRRQGEHSTGGWYDVIAFDMIHGFSNQEHGYHVSWNSERMQLIERTPREIKPESLPENPQVGSW